MAERAGAEITVAEGASHVAMMVDADGNRVPIPAEIPDLSDQAGE